MPDISWFALALSVVPALLVIWIGQRWSGSGMEIAWATLRMMVQLIAVGFVLIFIFRSDNPFVGIAVVAIMILASAWIGVRKVHQARRAAFLRALLAIGVPGSLILAFVLYIVLGIQDPVYQPRIAIPLAGMVFANAMTALTLAAERFESEITNGKAPIDARKDAWDAAMIPQVNGLLAVGLVSLPGMMTGQILSGVDPLIAVRYQIVVMAMILQAAGFGVAIFLWLGAKSQSGTD